MKKRLIYGETNAYDIIISIDEEGRCRYVTEKEWFPNLADCDDDEKTEKAEEFLRTIEDDSSWENDSYELSADEVLEYVDIIAEIERKIKMKKLINAMDEFGFCPKYELTATGKELVEKVEKETDYHFDKVVKGTIRFIPNEPEDDTSRWITVSNDGFVTAYRCGIGKGCFAVRSWTAKNVQDWLDGNTEACYDRAVWL